MPNPKLDFPMDLAKTEAAEAEAIAAIEAAVARDPDDIACLIVEPIQGEGGDNHFRGEFLRDLRTLADRHDFLLIFDEVQTGFGATGKWWAHQWFDVRPDILAFGKKTQTCGIAAGRRLDEVEGVFKVPSRINSTWGGNLVDMVRGTRIIEVIREEDLLDHWREAGRAPAQGSAGDPPRLPGIHLQSPGPRPLLRLGHRHARVCATPWWPKGTSWA